MADVVEYQHGPGQGGTEGQRVDALGQPALPGLVLDRGQPAVGLLLGGAAEATDPGGDQGDRWIGRDHFLRQPLEPAGHGGAPPPHARTPASAGQSAPQPGRTHRRRWRDRSPHRPGRPPDARPRPADAAAARARARGNQAAAAAARRTAGGSGTTLAGRPAAPGTEREVEGGVAHPRRRLAALLGLVGARHADAEALTKDQIAKTSSSNATTTRRFVDALSVTTSTGVILVVLMACSTNRRAGLASRCEDRNTSMTCPNWSIAR